MPRKGLKPRDHIENFKHNTILLVEKKLFQLNLGGVNFTPFVPFWGLSPLFYSCFVRPVWWAESTSTRHLGLGFPFNAHGSTGRANSASSHESSEPGNAYQSFSPGCVWSGVLEEGKGNGGKHRKKKKKEREKRKRKKQKKKRKEKEKKRHNWERRVIRHEN